MGITSTSSDPDTQINAPVMWFAMFTSIDGGTTSAMHDLIFGVN